MSSKKGLITHFFKVKGKNSSKKKRKKKKRKKVVDDEDVGEMEQNTSLNEFRFDNRGEEIIPLSRKRVREDDEENLEFLDDEETPPRKKKAKVENFRFEDNSELPDRDEERRSQFQNVLKINSRKKDGDEEPFSKNPRKKFTPLEEQVIKLKEKYPDLLLVVEVGYKFTFYGEDARIASEVLKIGCYRKGYFLNASFPIARMNYHVKKLVKQGHKVGVVRQKETAAIKKDSKKKGTASKLFTRELDKVFTASTFISDSGETAEEFDSECNILVIYEEKNLFSIVACEVSTGQIQWDEWEEESGFMRRELHSRLIEIKPVEVLADPKLSVETEKMLKSMKFITRFERTKFTVDFMVTSELEKFSRGIQICLHQLETYLKKYEMNQVITLSDPVQLRKDHMTLNGITLDNLEILQSSDGKYKGSLISFLDRTKTKFGRRMLRRWITNPLKKKSEIEKRLNSVEYLMHLEEDSVLNRFCKDSLKVLPDLERLFFRVIYQRIRPKLLLESLLKIQNLLNIVKLLKESDINDEYLKEVVLELPQKFFALQVDSVLDSFSHDAAKRNDFDELFLEDSEEHPKIAEHICSMERILTKLEAHLEEIREIVDHPDLQYKKLQNEEFLVEIRNSDLDEIEIPEEWDLMSKTKTNSRYLTPTAKKYSHKLMVEREHVRELSKVIWIDLLKNFGTNIVSMQKLVDGLSVVDCLHSLSLVSCSSSFTRPIFVESERMLEIENGRHPIVEALLLKEGKQFIPNSILMKSGECQCVVITGPNMGGKSVLIKQVALITLMAQIGCFVPADVCKLSPFEKVITRMGAYDDIVSGSSTFHIEASEASQMLKQCTKKSLLILDELGRGTSTSDGCAIAYSTLEYLQKIGAFTLFVTHYPEVAKLELHRKGIKNFHMSYNVEGDSDDVTLLYKLQAGVSGSSYGINVANLAGVDSSITNSAGSISRMISSINESNERSLNFLRMLNFPNEMFGGVVALQKEVRNSLKKIS